MSDPVAAFDLKISNQISPPDLLKQTAITYNTTPTPQSTFSYAYALSHSAKQSERVYGLQLFDQLIASNYDHSVDCFYGSAVAQYLNGDFTGSRKSVEAILRANPENERALELHAATIQIIERKERQENIAVGTGVLAVGVGLVVGIAGILIGKKR